ncbi:MAG TPA: hypothetical protein VJV21_02920 [Pyrinomonadaceae bacterium]|nr:hypothetical protein [Pyrinomonadaceae bacterium]
MRLSVIFTIVLCSCLSLAQSADRPLQQTAQAKQYFIAIFSRGTAWDDAKPANEQIGFKDHSENLRRLRAEKRIAIGGRYGDKGMVIVEATSEDDARSLFAADVMVSKKTFTLELQQFRPFYKGSIE